MALIFLTCALALHGQTNSDQAKWLQDLNAWRTKYASVISAPDGWLSLVALDWLKPGDNSVGSAATNGIRIAGTPPQLFLMHEQYGQIETRNIDNASARDITVIAIRITPPRRLAKYPADFLVDGKTPGSNEQVDINMTDPGLPFVVPDKIPPPRSEEQRKKDAWHPSTLTIGTLTMTVIHRGNNAALRVRDSNAPTRKNFHGLNWYPPDQSYAVLAKWIPYNPIKKFSMSTVIGTTLQMPCPGAVEFTLQGKTFRLEPVVEDPDEGRLFFVMRDLSSNASGKSYPAGRFLYTPYPSHGLDQPGELWLDFNRLENPPCAYTAFATCPLPAKANRLEIALPVGEQRYHN